MPLKYFRVKNPNDKLRESVSPYVYIWFYGGAGGGREFVFYDQVGFEKGFFQIKNKAFNLLITFGNLNGEVIVVAFFFNSFYHRISLSQTTWQNQ